MQEIVAHALDALHLIAALPRLGRGDISQDLASLTEWYELGVDLTRARSCMRKIRPFQRDPLLGAFLASAYSKIFARAS